MNLKEQRQLYYELACQKDTKSGRFLSSMPAWDRVRLGLAVISMAADLSEIPPSQLIICACKGRQTSEFICNVKKKKMPCWFFSKNQGSWNVDS